MVRSGYVRAFPPFQHENVTFGGTNALHIFSSIWRNNDSNWKFVLILHDSYQHSHLKYLTTNSQSHLQMGGKLFLAAEKCLISAPS